MDVAVILVHMVLCLMSNPGTCMEVDIKFTAKQRTFTSVDNVNCKDASEYIKVEIKEWFENKNHHDWALKSFYCRDIRPYREH